MNTSTQSADFTLQLLEHLQTSESGLFKDLFIFKENSAGPFFESDAKATGIAFAINCNDLFAYACADCELITPENFQLLQDTEAELLKMGSAPISGRPYVKWTGELFAARIRKARILDAYFTRGIIPPGLKPLFDACTEKP